MSSVKSKVLIGDLKFSLYRRLLHPELFRIYARERYVCEAYDLQVWVTGWGHVVSVSCGDKMFSELISGPGQELPRGGLVERFCLECDRDHRCSLNRSLGYMSVLSIEMMTDSMYVKSLASFEKAAEKKGSFVRFPKSVSGGLEPFSFVDLDASSEQLNVRSYHVYPDQGAVVKMQSRISLPK